MRPATPTPFWLRAVASALCIGLGALLTILGLELVLARDVLPLLLPNDGPRLGPLLFLSLALVSLLGCPSAFGLILAR
jgi:hypothetical protein